jgi:hypothetical protein
MTPRWYGINIHALSLLGFAAVFTDNHQEAPLAGRVVALDGFRAIAFLAVFAHHVFRVPLLWA